MATGIRQRHGRGCNTKGRCKCPYEAFVYGKRDREKIRRTFPDDAAAKAWRDDANSAVRRKAMRASTSTTLREAADAWLEGARSGLIRPRSQQPYKPSAIRNYEQHLRLRALPELGSRRLSDITRTDLQDRIAPPEEGARLLDALPAAERVIWATAMYGGLRRGELMALHVEDIDLGAGVIHVRRGWDRYHGEITPKSGRTRRVPIAVVLRDHLDEHLLRLGRTGGLVFGLDADTPFSIATTLYRARRAWGGRQRVQDGKGTRLWVPDEKRTTLQPITLHECRHTYASLMIDVGVNVKALSTYMGHASIAITMDRYGHLMPGGEGQAAGLLDAYLDRADSRARVSQMAA